MQEVKKHLEKSILDIRSSLRFCFKNDVKQFLIISSLGADKAAGNFYLKTKGEIEDFLKQSSFTSIYLRPSLL
jgi:uncharacterized protein YbjT (DUF2867 family)